MHTYTHTLSHLCVYDLHEDVRMHVTMPVCACRGVVQYVYASMDIDR